MTKQEYEARMSELYFNRNLQQINKLLLKCAAKDKYIASLEAENAALTAKNAELERLVEKTIEKLAIRCPLQRWERYCPKPDNISCTTCWREFLMQETTDGATQIDLPVADATQEEGK